MRPKYRTVRSVLSRRRFLRASASASVTALGLGAYTWQIEPYWLDVTHRALPIHNLPAALHGRTLAQLSDIHVGPRVSDAYVLETFDRIQRLAPDFVVYTGDFTSRHGNMFAHAEAMYDAAPLGRLGTFGIFGNHEYGQDWAEPDVADRFARLLIDRGIRILRNEVAESAGLQFAGMDDLWAGRFAPAPTLAALDRSRPALVLSHNPDSVDEPGWDGYEGWILSGHTHGGQCKPPFLPPPILPVRNTRYTSGAFALSGNRNLYINRGVGHLIQVRFNVRPEVTLFELQPA